MNKNCLVIGAGMAGLTAARTLQQNGWQTTVLDKGRGLGGRLATRRIEAGKADHGAQYFTVRTPEFEKLVATMQQVGVVKPWDLRTSQHPLFVGVEGMNAVAKFLANGLDVRTNERVVSIAQNDTDCTATTETGNRFTASHVIITAPAPQVISLLKDSGIALPEQQVNDLQSIVYVPCLAVMVVLNQPSQIPVPGSLKFDNGPVAWVADNQQKGISPQLPTLTIHASPAFSRAHLESNLDQTGAQLIEALREWIPADTVVSYQVHRWRYSLAERTQPDPFLVAQTPFSLLIGGDGFGMGNVEGAFLSGWNMAQHLLQYP